MNKPSPRALAFHPLANVFPLMDGEEFEALRLDIAEHGVREPVIVHDGLILDGRNRYRASQMAGVDCLISMFDGDDPLAFVISMNLRRRHMDESQRAMVAAKLATLPHGVRADRQQSPIGNSTTQARAADLLNVGKRSVERAREVIDDGAPELVEAVERGLVSVSAASDVASLPRPQQREIVARGEREILQAAKQIRTERAEARRCEVEAVRAILPAPPTGRYGTIIIDPPWPMEKIERDVRPNQVGFDYPTMDEQELAGFDVSGLADDDCHLLCWTTNKFLPMSMRLIEAWDFRYVLTMVWHKPGGFQPIGLPQYNCEFIVYARKGTPRFVDTKAFPCCFEAPRREHSRKPDEFYDVIRRVTDGARIDVFSRGSHEGFDQFGNEADKFAGAA